MYEQAILKAKQCKSWAICAIKMNAVLFCFNDKEAAAKKKGN